MGKKIILISFEVLFLGLCLFIVLQSTSLFTYATDRAKTIIDLQNVKAFFELTSDDIFYEYIYELYENVLRIFRYIIELDIEKILTLLWDFILDFIIYFCNFGLNIILVISIILHESCKFNLFNLLLSYLNQKSA